MQDEPQRVHVKYPSVDEGIPALQADPKLLSAGVWTRANWSQGVCETPFGSCQPGARRVRVGVPESETWSRCVCKISSGGFQRLRRHQLRHSDSYLTNSALVSQLSFTNGGVLTL